MSLIVQKPVLDLRTLKLTIESLPDHAFIKDPNHQFLACNQNFATIAELETTEDIVGLDDYDFPWKSEAHIYFNSDITIFQHKKPLRNLIENQTNSSGERYEILVNKFPIMDNQDNIVAIIGSFRRLHDHEAQYIKIYTLYENYHKIYTLKKRKRFLMISEKQELYFTRQELICCILTVLGNTAASIALQLSVSKRTIESHLEHIKYKLQARTKPELISKILDSSLISLILT